MDAGPGAWALHIPIRPPYKIAFYDLTSSFLPTLHHQPTTHDYR